MHSCPICRREAVYTPRGDRDLRWQCEKCGNLRFTGTATQLIDSFRVDVDPNRLSAIIRRQPCDADGWIRIDEYNLGDLISVARKKHKLACPNCGR